MGEELPGVLWAYRTTPGRPTGNTPFALAYGMDAVIPTEIGLLLSGLTQQKNDANTELGRNLDWADEVRESAAIRMADYQQRASAHYNRKVRPEASKMSASSSSLSAANSRSSSSFCAVKRSCKSSFCFFSMKPLSGVASPPPSAGPSHPLPHAGGPP
ncbi:hypothetical protein CK203_061270 [Vitis vinifera]|uniref:Uncharacterized protein n=1 Tax=Vitis vinifera TaxID=29760 RepID=A0A438G5B7_VITVI|nr:hypothetical protein CK203_061270 [Vitis vinifera]